jgi:trimeric autotransporter adhesin
MGIISYQWYANDVLISGAVNPTFTLTQNEVNKTITVKANYIDALNANESVISSATTSIVNVNDAPTVSLENIDIKVSFGDSYIKDISGLFSDIDFNNAFTYESINLPQGLSINPNTGIISGQVNQSGTFLIVLKATDSAGASITRTYNMIVNPPASTSNDTPVSSSGNDNQNNNLNSQTTDLNNFNDNSNNNVGVINASSNGNNITDTGSGFLNVGDTPNNQESGDRNPSDENNNPSNSSNNNGNSKQMLQSNVDLNISTNGQIVFNQESQDSFSVVGITIEDIKFQDNYIEIKVVDSNFSQNFVVMQIDGSPLPQGLFFDTKTGNITGTVSEDIQELKISIKAVNSDGSTRVLNLTLNLKDLKQKNQVQIDERFIGFKEQIALENQKLDGYGSYLSKLFA